MANTSYELGGKTFLKCKECGTFKELNSDNWYSHNEGFLGVLGRCKECIKKGRKTERERKMSRVVDMKRYYNNASRRQYIYETALKRRQMKGYGKIHLLAERAIKKLGVRPIKCPFCGEEGRIVAHHYSYSDPLCVVFCCSVCHSKIHKNEIIIMDSQKVDLGKY